MHLFFYVLTVYLSIINCQETDLISTICTRCVDDAIKEIQITMGRILVEMNSDNFTKEKQEEIRKTLEELPKKIATVNLANSNYFNAETQRLYEKHSKKRSRFQKDLAKYLYGKMKEKKFIRRYKENPEDLSLLKEIYELQQQWDGVSKDLLELKDLLNEFNSIKNV